MNTLRFTRLAAALVVALTVTAAPAITIDWVTVGDPGNAADTTGDPNPAGAVADSYRIMKYEFTNQQYTAFLNSVAASRKAARRGDTPTRSSRTWATSR